MTILTKEDLEHLKISYSEFSEEELGKITTTEFNYEDFLEYKADNEDYNKKRRTVCNDINAWYRYNKFYQTILDKNSPVEIEEFFKDWDKDSNKDNLQLCGAFEYRENGVHITQENYREIASSDYANGLSTYPLALYQRPPFQEVICLKGEEAKKYLDHIYYENKRKI